MGLRYFATVNSETVQFDRVDNRNQSTKCDDTWGWHAPAGRWIKIERVVSYKSNNPSDHVCDARCMGATGRTMNCECACGGKNHGRGLVAEAA
jgi:hypothetical protein